MISQTVAAAWERTPPPDDMRIVWRWRYRDRHSGQRVVSEPMTLDEALDRDRDAEAIPGTMTMRSLSA
jgi:hypothetical protein